MKNQNYKVFGTPKALSLQFSNSTFDIYNEVYLPFNVLQKCYIVKLLSKFLIFSEENDMNQYVISLESP